MRLAAGLHPDPLGELQSYPLDLLAVIRGSGMEGNGKVRVG